jgi:hypothetical protein
MFPSSLTSLPLSQTSVLHYSKYKVEVWGGDDKKETCKLFPYTEEYFCMGPESL